ncbi:MAG: hypothetical protein K0R08_972 [Solimicrobium sp.]|jgi:hypothetical protein|nr:hypothetical protein [Solimicrobium sp.]
MMQKYVKVFRSRLRALLVSYLAHALSGVSGESMGDGRIDFSIFMEHL